MRDVLHGRLLLALLGAIAVTASVHAGDGSAPAASMAAAVDGAGADAVRTQLEQFLVNALPDERQRGKRPHAIIEAAAQRQLLLWAARLEQPTDAQKRGLKWLLTQPQLSQLLPLAVHADDDAAGVLRVLAALRAADADQLDRHAELVTALCVVWDESPDEKISAAEADTRAVALYRYYTTLRQPRYDLQAMPWQLLIYLADTRASVSELQWALRRYGDRRLDKVAKAYFDVRYDKVGLYFGEWQGIQGAPYTLANLVKHGGVCKDQAYYAEHVCRAVGIPSVRCQGRSGRGVGYHCWMGYLEAPQRGDATWNFSTARYEEHKFWSARIIDPHTREAISDGDVGLSAHLYATSRTERQLARALRAALPLLGGAEQRSTRESLLKAAIELSPGEREMWIKLADLYGEEGATPQQIETMTGAIKRFILNRYDEFGHDLFVRMIRAQAAGDQLRALSNAAKLFGHRPDLVSRLRLAQGDVLHKMGRSQRAVSTYNSVVARSYSQPAVVLDAMDRIDAVLRETGRLDELARYYSSIWEKMHTPKESGYAWTTPWFLVGQRYESLLNELGRQAEASKVHEALAARDTRKQDAPAAGG